MALDRSPDLFAYRFYVLVLFFCYSYSYVRQTKLASSLVNFQAHYKIVWLIDWLMKTVKRDTCSTKSYLVFCGSDRYQKRTANIYAVSFCIRSPGPLMRKYIGSDPWNTRVLSRRWKTFPKLSILTALMQVSIIYVVSFRWAYTFQHVQSNAT